MEVLYRVDLVGDDPSPICEEVIKRRGLKSNGAQHLKSLVEKTLSMLPEIDRAIQRSLTEWRLERLSYIDRAIIRLAACELMFFADVPFKVVIDQAVELARFFDTEGSARFVNGVLDALYKHQIKSQPK